MRLELTGRHVDISPAIRRLVEKKLAKLERLLDHRALSAQVVLTSGKRLRRADVTLHARGERFLHGVGEASQWEPAMTRAAEKIAQQAQKVKGKWQERKRTSLSEPAGGAEPVAEPAAARPPRARVHMPPIVKTSRQVIRPLSVSEAAEALDGRADGIVVFRDGETDGISVLVRSAAGELILVVTEA
jgi:putative sigma-54 modulation protein